MYKMFLFSALICANLLHGEGEVKNLWKQTGLTDVRTVIIVHYDQVLDRIPSATIVINDVPEMSKLKGMMSNVNYKDQLNVSWPTTIPVTNVYLMDGNGKYYNLSIENNTYRPLRERC